MRTVPMASSIMLAGLTRGLWWGTPAEHANAPNGLQRDSGPRDSRARHGTVRDGPVFCEADARGSRPSTAIRSAGSRS